MDLMVVAFDVEDFQVLSKFPLDRDEFDLAVKIPANATRDEFHVMLRNLLVERFRMKFHTESRKFPAFEMVPAKGGTKLGTEAAARFSSEAYSPQLAPGEPGLVSWNSMSRGHVVVRIRGQQQTLSRLAEVLRTAEPLPVVDRTGLTGK
jgi:uncharacterized protein (TIGR03435 family)